MKKSIYHLRPWTHFGIALSLILAITGYNHGLAHPTHVAYASNKAIHTSSNPGKHLLRHIEQGVQSEAVAPLFPVADAYVRGGNFRNENYGQDTVLLVKTVDNNLSFTRRAYLKFDITELPTSFTSVVLRLHVSRTDGTDQHSISLVPDTNWTEGAVTWNNKPAPVPEPLVSWSPGAAEETVSIDLTAAIQNEQAAGRSVVSFVISAASDRFIGYASRQASDALKRPQLVALTEDPDPRIEAESLVAEDSEYPLVVDDSNASGGKVLINNFTTSFVILPDISASGDGAYVFTIGYRNGSALRKSLIINGTTSKITLPNTNNQLGVYQQLIQLDTGSPNTIKLLTDFGDDQSGDYDYFELALAADEGPYNPVVNDETDLFGWSYAGNYPGVEFYEYSLDRGQTWTEAAENPISVGNVPYAVGQVQVRVEANPATDRPAGLPLLSDKAYSIQTTAPPTPLPGTPLWTLGRDDRSASELADYGSDSVDSLTVPDDWNSRSDWSILPKGLKLDQNGTLVINYSLGEVPTDGVEFRFRLLDAHQVTPQLAVFSNEILAGVIQLVGLEGSDVDLTFQEIYRLYIPKEFLQAGENKLRLSLDRGLYADETGDRFHRFVWDYLTLESLAEPATEPIHGRYVHLGNDFRANDANIKARTAFLLTKWSGVAYSGNWMRVGITIEQNNLADSRRAYLETLRDLNFNTMPLVFSTNFLNDEAAGGSVTTKGIKQFETYLESYGDLLTALEISNEPGLFNTEQVSNVAVTQLVLDKRATYAPQLKVVAPGWAYWPTNGTPSGWARQPDQRRPVEELADLTNGHSYTTSGTQGIGGSLAETLRTYNDYDGDGFPKPMVMSETGGNDKAADNNAYGTFSNKFAAVFDREMRANIGYVDHIMYHGDYSPKSFAMFDYPGDLDDFIPTNAVAHPNESEPENPRLKTYRRLALAYATHGAPLTYEYLNREELAGKKAYFRAVNTATLGTSSIGAQSDKLLVNFTNFDTESLTMSVRVVMPEGTQYVGDRFGPGDSYAASHSRANISPEGDNSLVLTETLGPGESVQYILNAQESAAPSVPTDLVATTKDFNRIDIDWELSEDNVAVAGYNIYRNDEFINVVPAAVTFYADKNIVENTQYTYTVAAFDDSNNESARSTPATATTDTIPTTPGGPKYEAEDCIPPGASFPRVINDAQASGGKIVWNNFYTSKCKIYGVVAEQEDYLITLRYRSPRDAARDFLINEELPIARTKASVRLPKTGNGFQEVQQQIKLVPGEKNIVTIYTRFGQDQEVVYDYFVLEPGTLPEPVAEWRPVDDNSSAILYSAGFTENGGGTAHEAANAGERAAFTFDGTGIRWYSNIVASYGSAVVFIDGIATDTVDIPSAAFEGPDKQVLEITELEEGIHTVEIVSLSNATITLTKLEYLGIDDILVPPGPDVIVQDIKTIPADAPGGEPIIFVAVVKNIGTLPTPDGVITGVLFSADGGNLGFSDTYTAAIAPGEVVEIPQVSNPWQSPTNDTVMVSAFVDDINRYKNQGGVDEQSRSNNKLSKEFIFVKGSSSTTQTPYVTHSVPGLIQAQDYDNGGEGVAYSDTDATNQGGGYRDDAVDIGATSDPKGEGYSVGWIRDGEWLEYTIANVSSGTYDIKFRVASDVTNSKSLTVILNGNTLGTLNLDNTGGWQSWETVTLSNVSVPGGSNQVLRLNVGGGSFNLNYVEFVPVVNIIQEAEEAILSEALIGSTHSGYTGSGYANYDNVTGSYVEWTLDVPTTGSYQLSFRYANGATANRPCALRINGTVVNPGVDFSTTGAWTNYGTASTLVDLVAGENIIRATANLASGGPNMDNLTVTSASSLAARTSDQKTKAGIEVSVETSIQVFPNPAQGVVYLRVGKNRVDDLYFTDILGRKYASRYQFGSDNALTIPVDQLPAGIYFLHATINERSFVKRLIIDSQ